ncbi:MAG: SdpI family protein [Candidatus Omnitrophica bacterium]|nr:SdpI family protein [Candidatus Omnitrophota bacterium]MDE2009035.1 SdpI family protein [Candidatus Omnitrophota bacterium]MDE2215463.1 SdpI family protein [Candidatus Omnitrophota bacterium]MDE2230877.1 SdpI family protein [Candidatus Omnitrophota bacterium]
MDLKLKTIMTFVVPALLFVMISMPLIIRKVPRNFGYGFRTKKTLSSDEMWYKANRFGGAAVLTAALLTLTGCLWLFYHRNNFSADAINSFGFGLFITPVLAAVAVSLIYIKSL